MIVRVLLLLSVLVACIGDVEAQRVVTFARGAMEVVLPETFIVTERNDGSLRAVFGSAGDHRLELTAHEAPSAAKARDAGEEFVRAEAKKKDLVFFELPGKVVFMEPRPDTKDGDKAYRAAYWQIGFGNTVVVMTLTGPAQLSPELSQFLGKPLNDVINSLRRKAA